MQDKFIQFENRLSKVYRHLSKMAKKQQVSCYRLYNVDLPEFPFIIDIYKQTVYVAEYKSKHKLTDDEYNDWLQTSLQIIGNVLQVSQDNIYLKLRERQKGVQQYNKLQQEKKELIVEENGLSFIVNLSDYLDTGLFLDHRLTRQKVKEISGQKNVLNLFAYTGSFSVYAAAGNANKIVTVDMSKTYLNWARRNLAYNKLYEDNKHFFIQDDTLHFLKNETHNSYDLIILDPPTFSNSKRMDGTLDIQRDHVDIINRCLLLLKENGILIFSTNYRSFKLDASSLATTKIKDITKQTIPFDFEGKLQRACYWIEK